MDDPETAYVTSRHNRRNDQLRWYWQCAGFPLVRLPDDETKRRAEAKRLNGWGLVAGGQARFWESFWLAAKKRAQSRGVEFTITLEHFLGVVKRSGGRCEVSGLAFETNLIEKVGIGNPYQPSIDRIETRSGYVPGNCRLVCLAVNIAINKWGDAVFLRIAEAATKRAQMLTVRAEGA